MNISFLLSLKWFLDQAYQLAQSAKYRSKAKAPALDADCVDEKVYEHPIGYTECQEDAKICNHVSVLLQKGPYA